MGDTAELHGRFSETSKPDWVRSTSVLDFFNYDAIRSVTASKNGQKNSAVPRLPFRSAKEARAQAAAAQSANNS
jgi:hypothetical protein